MLRNAPKEYRSGADQVIQLAKRVLPREFEQKEKPLWTVKGEGKSRQDLERMLNRGNIRVTSYAREGIYRPEFTTLKKGEVAELVAHSPSDLGFTGIATTAQIFEKGFEKYDPCPGEAAVLLRLLYKNQPEGEWLPVGMRPFPGSGGRPDIFALGRDEGLLCLSDHWADPARRWPPGRQFVFRLRE